MWGTIRRFFLLGIITIIAIWIGRMMYHVLKDFFDFQFMLYSYLLNTQQQIGNIKDTISESFTSFFGMLGGGTVGNAERLPSDVGDRLATFATKLKTISILISALGGLFTWKLLFDCLFGINIFFSRLKSFVNPLHDKKELE